MTSIRLMAAVAILVILRTTNQASNRPKDLDLQTWPRMTSQKFGCLLETSLKYRDPEFNCATGPKDTGDPCVNTTAYYAGPTFPEDKIRMVHPKIEAIDLNWEHGELQSVNVTLLEEFSETQVQKLLKVPIRPPYPENVSSISVQSCAKNKSCVILQGFNHIGAGDLDCPEPEAGQ